MGVKGYRVIFVFENDKALAHFLDSGCSGSAQADAAAKAGEAGGAYSGAVQVEPGVWVYQITKNGLALQVTLQGTKYYKDDDLSEPSGVTNFLCLPRAQESLGQTGTGNALMGRTPILFTS